MPFPCAGQRQAPPVRLMACRECDSTNVRRVVSANPATRPVIERPVGFRRPSPGGVRAGILMGTMWTSMSPEGSIDRPRRCPFGYMEITCAPGPGIRRPAGRRAIPAPPRELRTPG